MIPARLLTIAVMGLFATACQWTDLEKWQEDHDTGDGPTLLDADGDGVLEDEDCNDLDDTVFPGADEVAADGVDSDCDGMELCYSDGDGDGYGTADLIEGSIDCSQAGEAARTDDCDDVNPAVNPGAEEICDSYDNDCDGDFDDEDADLATVTQYQDNDGDGHAAPGAFSVDVASCERVPGFAFFDDDCDDEDASVSPSADEICNGLDDDCDGNADDLDDDVLDPNTYWADADADGAGDAASTIEACSRPEGYVGNADDCDDTDDARKPGAAEICDSLDNDCDGLTDDDDSAVVGAPTWFVDADGDDYGKSGAPLARCIQPTGYAAAVGDCDDTNDQVNPDATEVCNGLDDDCDGVSDGAGAQGAQAFYQDIDGDDHGGIGAASVVACTAPTGFVASEDDCNDVDANTFPGAVEICDNLDNDCDSEVDEDAVTIPWYRDDDGDGWGQTGDTQDSCAQPTGYVQKADDCDDTNSAVKPGATEICNGYDDDCDGDVDDDDTELVANTYYADDDGDTYGDAASTAIACSVPTGFVTNSTDCDDDDAAKNPGEAEICDSVDNDCDGLADDADTAVTGAPTWYRDSDGDTYGNPDNTSRKCVQPAGFIADDSDCDDAKPAVNPAADELCSTAFDDNCDGTVNEATATDAVAWYADTDSDLFGDASSSMLACTRPSGFRADNTDCDDDDSNTYPGATEICDLKDNDCDSTVDENAQPADWYPDGDNDGFGDADAAPESSCTAPAGKVADDSDCDDGRAGVNPAADELCSTPYDDDCDGAVNENNAVDVSTWYADSDGDTFGNSGSSQKACTRPTGYVAGSTDCDDTDTNVFPGAAEVCDGIDNDCDNAIDDADSGITGQATWYRDNDGDTFGDAGNTTLACNEPSGFLANSGDCDDGDAAVNPNASELCSTVYDDDCDGQVNEASASDAATWYADADGDDHGAASSGTVVQCAQPAGYFAVDDDCDDDDATTYTDATEICDLKDNDCDGDIDEGANPGDWYLDADDDGFGDAEDTNPEESCGQPAGRVANNTDCDDSRPNTNPGASEICDGIDNDCDGPVDEQAVDAVEWYVDNDGDTFGDPGTSLAACSPPSGWVGDNSDCLDTNPSINPGANEVCDGTDNDCDGDVDDADPSISGRPTWFRDSDGDDYGDPNTTQQLCTQPGGFIADNGDCDDSRVGVNPGAPERCATTFDDDCDGQTNEPSAVDTSDWYRDDDGDNFGSSVSGVVSACTAPTNHYANDDDCDDTLANTYPGAPEICDSIDNDCDGDVDENAGTQDWYIDSDDDGFGDVNDVSPVESCTAIAGRASNNSDCEDGDPEIRPTATEICDTLDNDCDTLIDDEDSSVQGQPTWYRDNDGDTYGNAAVTQMACEQPASFEGNSSDCDDTDANNFPGNTELCDGSDNDCDGDVDDDDGDVVGQAQFWLDDDGDGAGDPSIDGYFCNQPSNYADNADDCDDTNLDVNPYTDEICSTTYDDDCDGDINEPDAIDATSWYYDADGDSYGSSASGVVVDCTAPNDHYDKDDDCNDGVASIHPNATEVCNSEDDDCDGEVDEDTSPQQWYVDSDGDNFGDQYDTNPEESCAPIAGKASNNGDCRDDDFAIKPSAQEVCDGEDNDCDSLVDDDDGSLVGGSTWYRDADNDGWGNASVTTTACSPPSGYIGVSLDCVDSNGAINPGAAEICDSLDNDCDNKTDDNDDDVVGQPSWWVDADYDNYGDGSTAALLACVQPEGYASNPADCNDAQGLQNPDADEVCEDFYDNNCDGSWIDGCPTLQPALDIADTYFWRNLSNSRPTQSFATPGDRDGDNIDDLVIGGGAGQLYYVPSEEMFNQELGPYLISAFGEPATDRRVWVEAWPPTGLVLAGDPNGDENGQNSGAAYIFTAINEAGSVEDADFIYIGDTSNVAMGEGIAIGDVDLETWLNPSVFIGVPRMHVNEYESGAILVDHDEYCGDMSCVDFIIEGTRDTGHLGNDVARAGDFDGDGVSDYLFGGEGYTYAWLGTKGSGSAEIDDLYEAQFSVTSVNGRTSGTVVAGVDANRDGYTDALIGDQGFSSGQGRAYILYGPPQGEYTTALADVTLTLEGGGGGTTWFGGQVANIGSIDGDGFDDWAVAAPGAAGGRGRVYAVMKSVEPFTGSTVAIETVSQMTLEGSQTGDNVARGIAGQMDLDGDGLNDWGVATRYMNITNNDTGALMLYFGAYE